MNTFIKKDVIFIHTPYSTQNYAPVLTVDFSRYKRIIAVSDIHRDFNGFKGILNKIHFSSSDALVIVGDILEKGSHSLELLHEIVNLMKYGNIYMVAGNNDVIFEEWFSNQISTKAVHWYMHSRETSILIEMAKELNMGYDSFEEIEALKTAIKKHYQEEISFLCSLPYIIDSDIATFVHAGLESADLYTQNKEYCLTAKSFGDKQLSFSFEKPVVVGHWPTSNYREAIININPYYNEETNVYSIDGGNSMKRWQQINCLIFNNDGAITTRSYDNLPKIRLLEAQKETPNPITLTFPNTLVEVKERGERNSFCYFPYPNIELLIPNSTMYIYKGKEYCSDLTTYYLPIEVGDIVSLCGTVGDELLIKKKGIVGKYAGKYIEL